MAKQIFTPKVNALVSYKELEGVPKVIGATKLHGEKCFIQQFDVSKQLLLDEPQILVECSTLSPFQEDASQAAAWIVREATES